MAKLIVLRLTGNLPEGYAVTLEISEEGQRPYAEESGKLPPNPALSEKAAAHWRDKYRNLVAPYRRKHWPDEDHSSNSRSDFSPRIKPKKISYGGSVNDRIRDCRASANELKSLFLQWLNEPAFRAIDQCLRTHLNPGEVIRFLIRSEDTQLQKLPWQVWDIFKIFETEPSFGLTKLQPTRKNPFLEEKLSVKVLAILGHSDGIDVKEDEKLLKKLAPATRFLVEPTREEITDQLWAEPWDIIFFAGHSETEGDTGKIYINPQEYLTIEELWYSLRKAVENGLQVAIFNSCDGLGLAHRLISDFQIPHLIVMRELVPDQVAQEFLKHFLSAFAGGRPFHLAAGEARQRLQGLEGQFPCASWLPTVYQNPLDAALYWRSLTTPEEATQTTSDSGNGDQIPVRPRLTRKAIKQATAISLLVTVLVMGIRWVGVLESIELMAYDHMMRSRSIEARDPNILIVEVTPEDAEIYGYPIGDGALAEILETIQTANPRAIGLVAQRSQQRGTDAEREQLIDAFRQSRIDPLLQEKRNLMSMCSVNPNIDELLGAPPELSTEQRQNQIGFGDVSVDKDQVVRRQWLSYAPALAEVNTNCISGYSFALLLADQFLSAQGINKAPVEFPNQPANPVDWGLGKTLLRSFPIRFGGYQSLQKGQEQILLNYRNTLSGAPAQTVTLQELMDGEVDSATLRDRIVIIGQNNQFIIEPFSTPLGQLSPLYVHAHAVSNLINIGLEKRVQITALPQWMDGLLVLGTSWVMVVLMLSFQEMRRLNHYLLLGSTVLVLIYLIIRWFFIQGVWMPLVPMAVASIFAMFCALNRPFIRFRTESR